MSIKGFQIGEGSVQKYDYTELDNKPTVPVVDATLTTTGAAADAKATGDAVTELLSAISGVGSVPSAVRQAIYSLFNSAAYAETGLSGDIATIEAWASTVTALTVSPSTASISGTGTQQLTATTTPSGGTVSWESSDATVATVSSTGLVTGVGNGTTIITARSGDLSATCEITVSGFATLTGITAVYTQSGTVYDTASLDDLKSDLVVTATYDDSSTEVISSGYSLSGILSVGTSTITVSYGGKTTTFSVTVASTSIVDQDVTMGKSAQTILDQAITYDETAVYSFIYTFGSHTPIQTSTQPSAVVGPAASNGAIKGGAIQFAGSAGSWRYVLKGVGTSITLADGDVLAIVRDFEEKRTYVYLNGNLLTTSDEGPSYFRDTAKIYMGGDNAQMTVAPTHIKIVLGDLH